jgi:hypothetical protein
VQDVHALSPSEQARLRRAGEGSQRANRDVDRLVPRAADRAPGPVEQRPAGLAPDRRRQVFRPGANDISREGARDVCGHLGRRRRSLADALRLGRAAGYQTGQAQCARANELPSIDIRHRAADHTAELQGCSPCVPWLIQGACA